MPTIKLETAKLSKEQKKELIQEFTEVAARITKVSKSVFAVLIEEYPDENIGVAGDTLEHIKEKIKK